MRIYPKTFKRVCIEGNIGAGKSEVLKSLKNLFNENIRVEPIEAWSLLKPYYTNPKVYAFALQAQIIASFAEEEDLTGKRLFFERNERSSVEVFSKMLLDKKMITLSQFNLLCALYIEIPKNSPNLIIYLDVSPETCLQRIRMRGRECEEGIDLKYLKTLEGHYKTYMKSCEESGIPVIVIKAGDLKLSDQIAKEIMDIINLDVC
jgi:deoxyadenosine/deoxycytidine kinase